jgi:hypothetical protein
VNKKEIEIGKLYKYTGISGKAIWLHMHLGYIYPNEIGMILEANLTYSPQDGSGSIKIISQNGIVGYVFCSKGEWKKIQ